MATLAPQVNITLQQVEKKSVIYSKIGSKQPKAITILFQLKLMNLIAVS